MAPEMSTIREFLVQHRDRHLERVRALLRQPSISSEHRGVPEAAALLAEMHREAGFGTVELVQTGGYPVVYAHLDAGAPLTIGVYGYYDTNVVGEGWTHEPFEAPLG